MIDAFVEGVRSISQVCNLVIVVPVALMIIAARGRRPAAVGALIGVVFGGWIFAAGWVDVTDVRLRWSALVVAAIVGVLWITLRDGCELPGPRAAPQLAEQVDSPAAAAAGVAGAAAVVALIVTHWWRPCVGVELGQILTKTPDEPLRQFPAVTGFMIGVAIPLVLVALAFVAVRPSPRVVSKLSTGGAFVFVLLAASVVAGQHGEIVSRLFQWSQ